MRQYAAPNDVWQFAALVGMQSLLAATEQTEKLAAILDTTSEYGTTPRLFSIVDALAGADVNEFAGSVAQALRDDLFDINDFRLWFLGVWDAYRGPIEEARAIGDTLLARSAATGDRRTTLVARSLSAHIALADGDTTRAIQMFEALTPTADRAALQHPWESLGLERLMLARILLAAGRYEEALHAAASFDSPGATNITNTLFLPASLEIRSRVADALGDASAAMTIERRLNALKHRTM